jgi:hypothetical protein
LHGRYDTAIYSAYKRLAALSGDRILVEMKRIYAKVDQYVAVILVASLALVLSVYFSFQKTIVPRVFSLGLSATNGECVQPAMAAQKVNPNKFLFISCGGFLD